MDINRILNLIDERKDELFKLLSSFIKINTENFRSHGNEQNLAIKIHALCQDLGLESDMYSPLDIEGFENHPDYLPGRGLENRYNVTARWKGENGTDLGIGRISMTFYTNKTKEEIYKELAEVENSISARLEPMGIISDGITPRTRFFHYVFCNPDSEDIKLMTQASIEATGKEPPVCASCLSDLSVIAKYGSNEAISFGAGHDFSLPCGAHQHDEFINCDTFLDYTKTIATYILKVLG